MHFAWTDYGEWVGAWLRPGKIEPTQSLALVCHTRVFWEEWRWRIPDWVWCTGSRAQSAGCLTLPTERCARRFFLMGWKRTFGPCRAALLRAGHWNDIGTLRGFLPGMSVRLLRAVWNTYGRWSGSFGFQDFGNTESDQTMWPIS